MTGGPGPAPETLPAPDFVTLPVAKAHPTNPRKYVPWMPRPVERSQRSEASTLQCRLRVVRERSAASPRTPQPCLPDQGGCFCQVRLFPLTLCPDSSPAPPLLSGRGGCPARAPCPALEAPLPWEAVTRKPLPRIFLPACFSLFLVTGRSPPPSHTNPAQVRLQLCARLSICPPGELPASNPLWKAQLRGERHPFFPLRLQPEPPPPWHCPPGGANHIDILLNGAPGFAQCTTYTAEHAAERGSPAVAESPVRLAHCNTGRDQIPEKGRSPSSLPLRLSGPPPPQQHNMVEDGAAGSARPRSPADSHTEEMFYFVPVPSSR